MKTNLDRYYKTDEASEAQGIWFLISPDVGFRVKRWGGANAKMIQKKLSKYYKPYAKVIESGAMDDKAASKILYRAFVESCVVGWKGIEIDGQEAEFTEEKAIEFLCELPDLATSLLAYAEDVSNFREEEQGSIEDVGNS